MDATRIRQRYFAKPFQPFVLHLTDGREINVPKPESMMISSDEQQVLVKHPETDVAVIDLRTIRELKDDDPSATENKSGQDERSFTIVELREWLDSRPFTPFVIQLKGGREIVVQSRDKVLAVFSGRPTIVCQNGNQAIFDVDYIEQIREHQAAKSKSVDAN